MLVSCKKQATIISIKSVARISTPIQKQKNKHSYPETKDTANFLPEKGTSFMWNDINRNINQISNGSLLYGNKVIQ